jgi:hypothetical protein
MITNKEFFNAIEKSLEKSDNDNDDEEILKRFPLVNKKDICIIRITLQYLFTVGLKKFDDDDSDDNNSNDNDIRQVRHLLNIILLKKTFF